MERVVLIFVAGPPGSGKSTIGRAIASCLRYAYVDLDTVSAPFFQNELDRDAGFKDTRRYQRQFRSIEYHALLSLATENLSLGIGCVAVAPFTRERKNPHFQEALSERYGCSARTVGITITIEPQQQLKNLLARNARRDTQKVHAMTESAGDSAPSVWNLATTATISFAELVGQPESVLQRVKDAIAPF